MVQLCFTLQVLPLGFTEYIPAPPFPGAIIVNVADLMQRWTADRLKSTVSQLHAL